MRLFRLSSALRLRSMMVFIDEFSIIPFWERHLFKVYWVFLITVLLPCSTVFSWLLKDWIGRRVLKLYPETLVEAPLFLCILDIYDNSRLRVDNFRIWDSLLGLLVNLLLLSSYVPEG